MEQKQDEHSTSCDHCWMFPEHLSLAPPAAYKVTVKSHAAEGDFMIHTVNVDQVLHNSPGEVDSDQRGFS